MNKNYLIIGVLMSFLMMSSCTSSETEDDLTSKGSPAKVYLTLNTDGMTRATSISTANEKIISGGFACAFDVNDAKIGAVQSFTAYNDASQPSISTTTQATQVSVAANVSSQSTDFSSVTNRSSFEGVTTSLSNTTSNVQTYRSQDGTNLPMYGNQTFTFTSNAANPKVDLDHTVCKIELSSITWNFSYTGYAGASFVPKEVFLYNANTKCTLDGITGSIPVSGESSDASCAFNSTNTSYLSTGDISSYNQSSPTPYVFYSFPNGSTTPTKIIIKGTFTPSAGGASTVYYPIVINKLQSNTDISLDGGTTKITSHTDDSQVLKNHHYKISIIINGKGVDNVADDINSSTVKIQMNVTNWTAYDQKVTIK